MGISKRAAENAVSFWVTNNILLKTETGFIMAPTKPAASVETVQDDGLSAPQQDEEVDEETTILQTADKFRPHAINVLQARPKDKFNIDSFYNFFVRFVRGADFKIMKDDFVKLIPIWEQQGWIKIENGVIILLKRQ